MYPPYSLSLPQTKSDKTISSTLGRECAVYPFSIARRVFNVSLVCKSPSTPNCARQISLSPFDKRGGGYYAIPFVFQEKKTDDDGSVFSPILHTASAPKPVFLLSHQTKRADRPTGSRGSTRRGCGAVPGCTLRGGEKSRDCGLRRHQRGIPRRRRTRSTRRGVDLRSHRG